MCRCLVATLSGVEMTLDEYMKQNELTDDAMAKRLGVSRSAVTQYRNGDRMPKPEILIRLLNITKEDVTVEDMLAGLKRL